MDHIRHPHGVPRRVRTRDFLAQHPIFTVEEFAAALKRSPDDPAVLRRIGRNYRNGKLKRVARGVYAAVPQSINPTRFQPDPFLVLTAMRPDAVFAGLGALELLGGAWSEELVVLTQQLSRRRRLGERTLRFVLHAPQLRGKAVLGTVTAQRVGRTVRCVGPERFIVEGLRGPRNVAALAEHLRLTARFDRLDLDLVVRLLRAYDERQLYAVVGWFLEQRREQFRVPKGFLAYLQKRRPAGKHCYPRGIRGGRLAARWNLLVPASLPASVSVRATCQ